MKEVLALIETKKQVFAQTPFIKFLQDKTIDSQQKLAFAPYLSPFIMGFAELNKYVWREKETKDPIQLLINQHTYEDDGHWVWFLEDLQKLGFDISLNFSDSLRFLWSNETKLARQIIYDAYRYTYRANPIYKLAVIETMEAAAYAFFSATIKIIPELKHHQECKFFGMYHFETESEHNKNSCEIQEYLNGIQISEYEFLEIVKLIEKVSELFINFFNQLFILAQTQNCKRFQQYSNIVEYTVSKSSMIQIKNSCIAHKEETYKIKPIGAYLLEARIITPEQLEVALTEHKKSFKRLGEFISNQGWVQQETIEYMVEKVIIPERNLSLSFKNASFMVV